MTLNLIDATTLRIAEPFLRVFNSQFINQTFEILAKEVLHLNLFESDIVCDLLNIAGTEWRVASR